LCSERKRLLPEDYLQHAMQARSPVARANWAERGLAYRGGIDRTTKTMLLRQLYLAFYASGHYARAYEVAVQAVALGVLEDVVLQDCARAKQAAGDIAAAVGHLRLAARRAPPSRRAFHYWTLGAVLYLTGRHAEAIGALTRAARWGTRDKPLYQGHLALAKQGAGMKVRGLAQLIARLAACPAGQGYGRFVLGQLAYGSQRFDEARQYLSSFVARTTRGHATMALALAGELQMARQTLAAMREAS
jgi:tetratricopeptide (TPR) repeat protein